jgi:hypothetical protein
MAPENFNDLNCKHSTMILQQVNFQMSSFQESEIWKTRLSASLSVWYQNQRAYNEMNIPKGK